MTRTLAQVMAAAAPGDAVTEQALQWKGVLDRAGVRSTIHAQHIHPGLAGQVRPLAAAPQDGSPLLLRYSIWSDAAAIALRTPGALGVVYHNITPANLVRDTSPTLADLCAQGRAALPRFRRKVSAVIADSSYNAQELLDAGWPEPTVIPLLLDLPSPPPAKAVVPPRLLFVGRVVPSKRVDDVIRVLAYVQRHHLPDATLEIVGSTTDMPGYADHLQSLANDICVPQSVVLRGRVSQQQRDAAYEAAGAYASMSAHEGFCAPLLEAMSRGLPVIARGAGAVPETTGHAALLVPGPDIALAGEAVCIALTDARVRRGLRTNVLHRLHALERRRIEPRILNALAPLYPG